MDVVLGNMADDRDLEDWLVSSVAKAEGDDEVDAAFDRRPQGPPRRPPHYRPAPDDALFGKDFEA